MSTSSVIVFQAPNSTAKITSRNLSLKQRSAHTCGGLPAKTDHLGGDRECAKMLLEKKKKKKKRWEILKKTTKAHLREPVLSPLFLSVLEAICWALKGKGCSQVWLGMRKGSGDNRLWPVLVSRFSANSQQVAAWHTIHLKPLFVMKWRQKLNAGKRRLSLKHDSCCKFVSWSWRRFPLVLEIRSSSCFCGHSRSWLAGGRNQLFLSQTQQGHRPVYTYRTTSRIVRGILYQF